MGRKSRDKGQRGEREAAKERAAIEAEENARKADVRRRAGLPEEGVSEADLKARAAGQEIVPAPGTAGTAVATPGQ